MRIGDKEVEYNINFRFYIIIKFFNFYYSLEILVKIIIVNFVVKE